MELKIEDFTECNLKYPDKVILTGDYKNWRILSRMQRKEVKTYRDKSFLLIECIDCGAKKIVHIDSYTRILKEHICIPRFIKGNRTRIYEIYTQMNRRCYDSGNKDYHRYGGRGIYICSEWLNSYDLFYLWAMENGYDDSKSIDRIDPNKEYSPSNCRWATSKEQARNKRNTLYITINGVTKPLIDYCDEYKKDYSKIYTMLYKNNKTVEEVFGIIY